MNLLRSGLFPGLVRMQTTSAVRNKFKVLFCGTEFPAGIQLCRERTSSDVWEFHAVDRSKVREAIRDLRPDVIAPLMYRLGREEIMQAAAQGGTGLKLIHQFGAGLEGVDIQCAEEIGVKVMNIPAAATPNAASCAEHAVFLTLALLRRLAEMDRALTDRMLGHPIGECISGKNVLIVGFGAIGKECNHRFNAFGANVSAFRNRAWTNAERALVGGEKASVEENGEEKLIDMASRTHILIVCTPLNISTRAIIGKQVLSAMPASGLVINVARGGVIDEAAILETLATRRIGGFGTDVFWGEPFDPLDADQGGVTKLRRLLSEGANIVLTPHVAGVTTASYSKMADVFVKNINAELSVGR